MLNIMIVVGMICLVVIGSMGIALRLYRKKVERERLEYRKQRDIARQIRLQRKIDEFNAFKKSIGYTEEDELEYERKLYEEEKEKSKNTKCDHEYNYKDCDEDCMECREFYYQRYEKCKNARKYYDSRPVLKNIRVTLQDCTIQEVLTLYKDFAS